MAPGWPEARAGVPCCPPELPSGMFSGSRHELSVQNLPGNSRGRGAHALACRPWLPFNAVLRSRQCSVRVSLRGLGGGKTERTLFNVSRVSFQPIPTPESARGGRDGGREKEKRSWRPKSSVRGNQIGLLPLAKSNLLSPPTFSLQTLPSIESGKKAQDFYVFNKWSFCQMWTVSWPWRRYEPLR